MIKIKNILIENPESDTKFITIRGFYYVASNLKIGDYIDQQGMDIFPILKGQKFTYNSKTEELIPEGKSGFKLPINDLKKYAKFIKEI